MCVMRGFKLNEGKGAAIHQRLLDVWQVILNVNLWAI